MRLPDHTKRTIVLGRTGSGKTVFSVWLLSKQNYDVMPWVIIDYKGDDLIDKVVAQVKARELKVTDKPPKKPGLYILRPRVKMDDEAVEAFLLAVYNQGDCGLFIDEGFALPDKFAYDMILTQGRALHIPVIACYQRPVYMNRYAVAQADFFAVFDQNDGRDLKTTAEFVRSAKAPNGAEITVKTRLPQFFSLWYDVGAGETIVLRPCPTDSDVLAIFARRFGVTNRRMLV